MEINIQVKSLQNLGHFNNDRKHGLGKFIYSNGKSIEGEWWEDKLNGEAKMTEPDGKSFYVRYNNYQTP